MLYKIFFKGNNELMMFLSIEIIFHTSCLKLALGRVLFQKSMKIIHCVEKVSVALRSPNSNKKNYPCCVRAAFLRRAFHLL